MRVTPARQALVKQLGFLRTEAVYARAAIEQGGQPAHGFHQQMVGALDSIALAGLGGSGTAARYAAQLRRTEAEPWNLGTVDRLIDRIDDAVKELSA